MLDGDISRRSFLKGAVATALALSLSGCRAKKDEKIVIYTAIKDKSTYQKESFDLASQYFKNEIGLDVEFMFCKEEDIPKDDLDHRTKIALIEQDHDRRAMQKLNENFDEFSEGDIEQKIDEYSKYSLDSGTQTGNDLDLDKLEKDIRELYLETYSTIAGEADTKNSTVYLIKNPTITNILSLKKASIMLTGKSSPELDDWLMKQSAMTIVHEISHLAGLWHTFSFTNDGLEDNIGDLPNVMSYNESGEGKYGFGMVERQKEQIKDYFKGGETFKKIKDYQFDINAFIENTAKEKNYKGMSVPGI